jgi:hypothetical protein
MKKWSIALILAGLLVLGAGGGILAQTPAVTRVAGNITDIDTDGNAVTITPDGGAAAITLNVTDSTEIEVPGKDEATLADLLAEDRVMARYESAAMNAIQIVVQAGRVQGEITALDVATVTVQTKVGDTVVLTVTDRTELEVWGKEPAMFDDLQVGMWVKAEYNATTEEAYVIEVTGKGEPSLAVRLGFFGTVEAKDDTSLTLGTKQGEVTLALDANTLCWDPPNRDATLANVSVGDRVAVLAEKQDSTLLAKRVLVIPPTPAKPVRIQVTATVTAVEGNTITLTGDSGDTYTIELPAGLASKAQVGDVLTITLLRTPGIEKYIASGMMKVEELWGRLQSMADKVRGNKPQTEEEQVKQSRDLENLGALLQQNMEKHQEQMNKVLEKAPPQAREALQKAVEKTHQGWEQAIAALEKDRTPTFRVR